MERGDTQARITLRNIFVPTDFSSASRVALFYALSLARRYGATLYLAHVAGGNPLRPGESIEPGSALDQAWRSRTGAAPQLAAQLTAELGGGANAAFEPPTNFFAPVLVKQKRLDGQTVAIDFGQPGDWSAA